MDGEEEGEKERDDFGFRDYFFFTLSNDICPTGWQWRGRPRAHQELVNRPDLRQKTSSGGLCAIIYRSASLA